MSTFKANLVSPEKLLFSDEVDQVDLPGLEGDFGVLAGHTPIVAALRPGIVDIRTADTRQRFVVLGGLAEFSKEELTVLADTASPVEEFDLADLMARIDQMQDNLAKTSIGEELDRAIEQLDHYKSLHKKFDPDHGLLAVGTSFSATVSG
jgi:ATP synthase, F1 epsilon subunit (delta in mitochondria)